MATPYELRYRNPSVKQPVDIQTNYFIENHLRRKTIRYFDPDAEVSLDQIKYLMAAAQCAPSSSGAQSWSTILLRRGIDRENFLLNAGEALGAHDYSNNQAFLNCSMYIVWLLDNYKLELAIRETAKGTCGSTITQIIKDRMPKRAPTLKNADLDNPPHFDADEHVEYLDQSYYCFRAFADATIAAQTFAMCAESIGLKTMYMGSLAHCDTRAFTENLLLPPRTFPIFGMCVGYENPDGTDHNGHSRPEVVMEYLRKRPHLQIKPIPPIETVMHIGKYDKSILIEKLHEYNEIVWEYTDSVQPRRPADYMVARVTCRVQQAHDHIELMRALGNKFGPPIKK